MQVLSDQQKVAKINQKLCVGPQGDDFCFCLTSGEPQEHRLKKNLYHPHCHKYSHSPQGETQLLVTGKRLKDLQLF